LTFSQISPDEKIARVLIDVMATEAKSLAGMPRLTPKPTSPPIPGESVTCETLEEAQEYYFLPDAFKRIKHPLVRRSDLQGILLVLCPPGRDVGPSTPFPSQQSSLPTNSRQGGRSQHRCSLYFPWDDEQYEDVQGKCGSGPFAPRFLTIPSMGPPPVHCSQALLTPNELVSWST
jgi:hypothetical protein